MRNVNAGQKREPADIRCVVCGAPVAECKVGGLHGMLRDRAAVATAQKRAR